MLVSDLVALVTGSVPRLSYLLAQQLVQEAWQEILDARQWSFLVDRGYLQCPNLLAQGTVTVTQGSPIVSADSVAAPLIAAFGIAPPVTSCQFRVNGGRIYNIIAWANPNLTLDFPYQEPSGAQQAFQIYRCYYGPPPNAQRPDTSYDFAGWVSVSDFTNQLPLVLGQQRQKIDLDDPARTNLGSPAYKIVSAQSSQGNLPAYPYPGTPLFEMYPHPQSQTFYGCVFMRSGQLLTPSAQFPLAVPPRCIRQGVLYHAYSWAEANKGRFMELQKSSFMGLMKESQAQFAIALAQAKQKDEEVFVQMLSSAGHSSNAWISGRYLQGHDPFGPDSF